MFKPVQTNFPPSPSTHLGFGLIEILIGLAILSITLTIGVPSMQEYFEQENQKSTRDGLTNAIKIARKEAISQKQTMILCPSPDGLSCENSWTRGNGWIVYQDTDRDNTLDNGEPIIVSSDRGVVMAVEITQNRIAFAGHGLATATRFNICANDTDNLDMQFELTRLGRIIFEADANDHCN